MAFQRSRKLVLISNPVNLLFPFKLIRKYRNKRQNVNLLTRATERKHEVFNEVC